MKFTMPVQACGSEPVSNGYNESSGAAVEGGEVNSGDEIMNTDSSREGSVGKIDVIVNIVFWDVGSKMKGQDSTIIKRYLTKTYKLVTFNIALVVLRNFATMYCRVLKYWRVVNQSCPKL